MLKSCANLDPQKYQLHLSDDGLSEEEEAEEETNENADDMFHGHIHNQHLQQPENSYRKSINIHQEKGPHSISSVATLAPKEEKLKFSKSKQRMQDGSNQLASMKLRPKRAKGDLVEAHGGRIVRSTGRKDRHSKVSTARGPRDRRVRLSPNTAIQFYDVQDRLGYDRPSKAIDWLMKEAKSAIDALDDSSGYIANYRKNAADLKQANDHTPHDQLVLHGFSPQQSQQQSELAKSGCGLQSQDYLNDINPISSCSLWSSNELHNYSHDDHHNSKYRNQTQGLCLSLHSFQDLSFLIGGGGGYEQGLIIPASTPLTNSEMARNDKLFSWNSNSSNAESTNSLPLHFVSAFDQNQLPSQREPLQSSFSPPLNQHLPNLNYAGIRFSNDGLSSELSVSAHEPPRIQAQNEQRTISSKPSSAMSFLHYQN